MTILIFAHAGWKVATAAWTATDGKGHPNLTEIVYAWRSEAGGGTSTMSLPVPFDDFLRLVEPGGMVDLRPHQRDSRRPKRTG